MVAVSLKKFFFQAEDGIRDWSVTGVQTCALPIFVDKIAATDVTGEKVIMEKVSVEPAANHFAY